jgi:hypothetical protein
MVVERSAVAAARHRVNFIGARHREFAEAIRAQKTADTLRSRELPEQCTFLVKHGILL